MGTVSTGPDKVIFHQLGILVRQSFLRRIGLRIGQELIGTMLLSQLLGFLGQSPIHKLLGGCHFRSLINDSYGA